MTVLALGDAGMTLAEAVEALREIGCEPAMRHDRDGREYWAHRCAHPEHRDSWPSATITEADDGTLLLNCFGCKIPPGHARTRWVAQCLGRLRARTPKEAPDPASRARRGTGSGGWGVKVAHYDYVSADGTLEARKVRFQPKSFVWQRPYGDGWADGLNRRPLHTLPMFGLASLDRPGPVFVVEGEKDAQRLHDLGAAAACAAGSAPGDIPDDLEPLRGRDVIVVADRDQVGATLARAWAERLAGVAAHVILAQPAVKQPKADISDHLDAGLGLDALDFGPVTAEEQPVTADPAPADLPPTLADELAADRLLADEVALLLRRARAREILGEIHERAHPKPAPDVGLVSDILARPVAEEWRIRSILPAGGRMLFTAQRKTGKTTATGNLAYCLLTGQKFLGHFDVQRIDGRIGVLNYEVTGAQFARWMDDIGVPGDRMYVENLRGCANPLASEEGREELIGRLRAHEVEILVVDPFGRAYHGKDQNDAAMVTPWLVTLDQVATQAGAGELILTAHAGWNGDRTRGSSALEDWPDVIVTLTKDAENDQRYIRADGRDVDLEEGRIEYHELTRTYTYAGGGSKREAARQRNLDRLVEALVAVVAANPGIGSNAIEAKWATDGADGTRVPHTKGDASKASREAISRGLVRVADGPNNAKLHYLTTELSTGSDASTPGTPEYPRSTPAGVPPVPLYTRGVPEGATGAEEVTGVPAPLPETIPTLGDLVHCNRCGRPTHPMSNPCTGCRRSS